MRRLESLLSYSRARILAAQVPPSLYSSVERRKAAIDTLATAIIAALIVGFSTVQFSSKASLQPPAVRQYIEHNTVETEVSE